MKYFFQEIDALATANFEKVIIFFDFDLTLSPLRNNPEKALLPKKTKQLLRALSFNVPVGIISGRSLDDVMKRVDLPDIMYAGSHGMEWFFNGKRYAPNVSLPQAFVQMQKEFLWLSSQYPKSTFIEEKRYSIVFHYRKAPKKMMKIIESHLSQLPIHDVHVYWDKKTFEVMPFSHWNKGDVCLFLLQSVGMKDVLPIYVGDSLTDEDAFRALSYGITIRVGQNDLSKAMYYIQDQAQMNRLIESFVAHAQHLNGK